MIDIVFENSFKKYHKSTYYQELQNIVNAQVLSHLFYLAAYENSYPQVNAIINAKLDEIRVYLKTVKSNTLQKMYNMELLKNIENFKKAPSKFKRTNAPTIPDGSPIGMD